MKMTIKSNKQAMIFRKCIGFMNRKLGYRVKRLILTRKYDKAVIDIRIEV